MLSNMDDIACPDCGRAFNSRDEYMAHRAYPCTSNEAIVIAHEAPVVSPGPTVAEMKVEAEVIVAHEAPVVAPGPTFTEMKDEAYRIFDSPNGRRMRACPFCECKIFSKSGFNTHVAARHIPGFPFENEKYTDICRCGRRFKNHRAMLRHVCPVEIVVSSISHKAPVVAPGPTVAEMKVEAGHTGCCAFPSFYPGPTVAELKVEAKVVDAPEAPHVSVLESVDRTKVEDQDETAYSVMAEVNPPLPPAGPVRTNRNIGPILAEYCSYCSNCHIIMIGNVIPKACMVCGEKDGLEPDIKILRYSLRC